MVKNSDLMSKVNANLRALRVRNRYTVIEFAELMNVSLGTVAKIELLKNAALPSLRYLARAGKLFDVLIDEILYEDWQLTEQEEKEYRSWTKVKAAKHRVINRASKKKESPVTKERIERLKEIAYGKHSHAQSYGVEK